MIPGLHTLRWMRRLSGVGALLWFCVPVVWASAPTQEAAEEVDQVTFWVAGMTRSRVEHESAVVRAALEATRDTYGDYELELDYSSISSERLLREVALGQIMNLVTAPAWSLVPEEEHRVFKLEVPLVKGLLGFRRCVIRAEDRERFAQLESPQELKALRLGMGQGWTDTRVLEHNGYEVVEAFDIEQLYFMLRRERFDCLPLGIGEVASSLTSHSAEGEFVIAENLLLYYPLPVLVQVSGTHPQLANRMAEGIRRIRENGTLGKLFEVHYGDEIEQLNRDPDERRLFVLENPFMPERWQSVGLDLLE